MRLAEKVKRSRGHADLALEAYRSGGGVDEHDGTAIGDLIADLLHLAEDRGVLPSEMPDFVARALDHYEYESNPAHADEEV